MRRRLLLFYLLIITRSRILKPFCESWNIHNSQVFSPPSRQADTAALKAFKVELPASPAASWQRWVLIRFSMPKLKRIFPIFRFFMYNNTQGKSSPPLIFPIWIALERVRWTRQTMGVCMKRSEVVVRAAPSPWRRKSPRIYGVCIARCGVFRRVVLQCCAVRAVLFFAVGTLATS